MAAASAEAQLGDQRSWPDAHLKARSLVATDLRRQDAAGSLLQEADIRSLQVKESQSIIGASKREPANMIEPEQLSDEDLAREAFEWRRRALSGEQDARGIAHELERELRRRSGALSTLGAALKPPPVRRKPWWRFWA